MSLKDKAKFLENEGSSNIVFDKTKAEQYIEEISQSTLEGIKLRIKNKGYQLKLGRKQIIGEVFCSFYYTTGDYIYHDLTNPCYVGAELYTNTAEEMNYITGQIIDRLEKEGCICKIKDEQTKGYRGEGFLNSILRTYVDHRVRIHYKLTW